MCIQLTVAEKMSAYILRKHVCFLFVQFSLLLINLKKRIEILWLYHYQRWWRDHIYNWCIIL